MSADPAPEDALRRRLRDDPDAAAHLAGLRRAVYGRDGSDDADRDALLAEERRLTAEGRRMLERDVAADAPARAAESGSATADTAAVAPARRRLLRPGPLSAAIAAACLLAGLASASAAGLLPDGDGDGARDPAPTSTPGPPSTPGPRLGMPVPDFTPQPPTETNGEPTDAETAAALRETADAAWEQILRERPDAVRPDVPIERVLEGEAWVRQQATCLGESGVRVQVIGTGDDARLGTDSADPVVRYVCRVRFPVAPGDG
ncbi:hypothetical protein BFL36_10150 [Clavibacter michiganensis]|uniref:Uncharacterized protein n=1 Tax=Clavibacter michiganensis TaxID=28447 RepID=A0A251YDS2_9MICO|nr:hypothetical protein BFL36_10150 [Clavibacter michiganensis]